MKDAVSLTWQLPYVCRMIKRAGLTPFGRAPSVWRLFFKYVFEGLKARKIDSRAVNS
jgi:hypothetical protein